MENYRMYWGRGGGPLYIMINVVGIYEARKVSVDLGVKSGDMI